MTSVSLAALRGGWAVLSPPSRDEYSSFPLDALSGTDTRLAVDRNGGRHLLVEYLGEPSPASAANSPLVERVWSLTFGGRNSTYLDIGCLNSGLWGVFDDLIVDVLANARSAPAPGASVKDALEDWRALFRTGLIRGMSRERRFGLFGELLVLQQSVALTSAEELESWVGPTGAPHDFEFRSRCVEVKAVGVSSVSTRIHGLEQLEAHDPKPLDLVVLAVVESEEGQTIASVLEQLLHSGVDASILRSRLSQTGWINDSAFDGPLAVSHVLHVPVGDATPRITTRMLLGGVPKGVAGIGYDISLDVLAGYGSGETLRGVVAKAIGI